MRTALAFAAVAVVIVAVCAAGFAGTAGARANIQDYLKGPKLFYPARHDLNGSATKLVIDVLGWNATRIDGNVGIGNGSVTTFDRTSTFEVECPGSSFMCGDVSTQPRAPGHKTVATGGERIAEANATVNAPGGA